MVKSEPSLAPQGVWMGKKLFRMSSLSPVAESGAAPRRAGGVPAGNRWHWRWGPGVLGLQFFLNQEVFSDDILSKCISYLYYHIGFFF